MSRFIIIEGGIGAGKTTLMNRLKRVFPEANFIGEYIEEEEIGRASCRERV